jgi:hypothetical protein
MRRTATTHVQVMEAARLARSTHFKIKEVGHPARANAVLSYCVAGQDKRLFVAFRLIFFIQRSFLQTGFLHAAVGCFAFGALHDAGGSTISHRILRSLDV